MPENYKDYNVTMLTGGCFWGNELYFQRIPGVIATYVGYTKGYKLVYKQVCSGTTGYTEIVQFTCDPEICSYECLLTVLLNAIDPTLLNYVKDD